MKMAYMNQSKRQHRLQALALGGKQNRMLHVAALNHLWASNDVIRRARLTLSARSYQVRNFQGGEITLNTYWLDNAYTRWNCWQHLRSDQVGAKHGETMTTLMQTDYFDVGHYIEISIGQWNKPLVEITT
jgi:uncharacterized protein YigE (DUF2233 family)